MQKAENLLKKNISESLKTLYGIEQEANELKIEITDPQFVGDYTFVVFPFVRFSKKKPEETAQEIGEFLSKNIVEIESFNVVKGFLNIELKASFWVDFYAENVLNNPYFGKNETGKDSKIMVEYSSPNTNKPLHLGHLRNIFLGYAISEIYKWNGYEVIKANLVNDRGIHICKSMLAWQKLGNGETPESSGLKGDHLVGKYYVAFDKAYKEELKNIINAENIDEKAAEKKSVWMKEAKEMLLKWEDNDAETRRIWTMMNGWVMDGFHQSYKTMNVDFDKFYFESNTYSLGKEIIEEGLQKNVFYKKDDGSVWVDLTAEGLDEKLLLRSDGTSVYMTQDIGTAELKYEEFKMNRSVYVVGNEQDYHFKVLFHILKKLNRPYADGLFHLSYGMVDLPSGKMKSREGTVVDADDLMAEMYETAKEKSMELGKIEQFNEQEKTELFEALGMGALKYFLLKVDPEKRMLFNPAASIELQGHTGPFVQYTHARIYSLLAQANFQATEKNNTVTELLKPEIELLKHIYKFPQVIQASAEQYNTALLANYLFDTAKIYNRFYQEVSVNKETDENKRNFRLQISNSTAQIIKNGLGILGIKSPNKM